MHDVLHDHDEISKVQSCPCGCGHDHSHEHDHEHSHDHGHEHFHDHSHDHGHEHTHDHGTDSRPHVHNPDGTVRYLAEGETVPAPKLRRRVSTAPKSEGCPCCGHSHPHDQPHVTDEHHHHHEEGEACGCSCCSSESPFSEASEKKDDSSGEDDEEGDQRGLWIAAGLFALSFLPFLEPWKFYVQLAAFALAGWGVAREAFEGLLKKDFFNENTLMLVASLGAAALGDGAEAAAVMIFYRVGEGLQERAVRRSRRDIAALMDIRPESALRLRGAEQERVSPEDLAVGDEILIVPGERIPVDALVLSGSSALDQSALTGESLPRDVAQGDEILSGAVNMTGTLKARTLRLSSESAASRILKMVADAASRKAPTERFIRRFARGYTPAVFLAAALLALVPPLFFGGAWETWIYRALIFLVISCPCALVLSVPLAFFAGIGAASKLGVLMKGGHSLEVLAKSDVIVYDKTGTLTRGRFSVSRLSPADGVTDRELLAAAAAAERGSTHPIARSVTAAYEALVPGAFAGLGGAQITERAGMGVIADVDGRRVAVGNGALMKNEGVALPELHGDPSATALLVARGGQFIGEIEVSDEVKPDSAEAIQRLRADGVSRQVMLSGDRREIAEAVARSLGLDEVRASLLPDQKVRAVEELMKLRRPGGTLLFVGDGINDAPVLAASDAGVAMGQLGSDAAMEAADIVLMTDEPSRLVPARRLAKKTLSIARQNVAFALSVKLGVMALGAAGFASMWAAMFADVGVALLAVLNALRAMRVTSAR